MRSSLVGCRGRRDNPEPIWANGDLPVGLCQQRSTQKLLPAPSHMSCLHPGAQQWIRWCVCLEGDSPTEMGKQTLNYNLPLMVKRCAWNAVCGTFTWLLSPQVSPQVALRCVFLENRTDLPCDLRQAPPHASLWNQCNKSNWLPGVIGEKSEIIPVKYLTWFITQSNYLLSIGCRYYYCSCCFIGSQGTHDRA